MLADSTQPLQPIKHQLALWQIPGINAGLFHRLLAAVSDIEELFQYSAKQLQALGLKEKVCAAIAAPDWSAIEKAQAWAEQQHHSIVHIDDDAYPELLREIADPPPFLYCRGDSRLLASHQLAIVGSRNPSKMGEETAEQFAHLLASHGLTVTSGLALGIDAASHRGALKAHGKTIAVMGTGIDQLYPVRNRPLATNIIEHGLVITEFPHGTFAHPGNFPKRNRLISGLSMGVLVVEAALRSGSLITARMASEQGREVFAIPSSIHNPLAKGCHHLIRQGAKLVESADHIIEELGALTEHVNEQYSARKVRQALDITQQKLVKCVGYEMTPVDVVIDRSGLSSEITVSELVKMQLAGYIRAIPGGYIRV